jgi:hypothetical protein
MERNLKKPGKTNILVTGDFIVDRNILPGQRQFAADSPEKGTRLVDIFGGSLLTSSLMRSLINDNGTKNLTCSFDLLKPDLNKFISDFPDRTAFSKWMKQNQDTDWKIDEMNGYGFTFSDKKSYNYSRKAKTDSFKWIIIDEGNLGFRNCDGAWPDFTGKNVILKCSYPFHEGKLLRRLVQKNQKPEKLFIMITLSNLRKSDVRISSGISWEQTALDITCELRRNKKLSDLLVADHLIVMVGTSGALHFQNSEDKRKTEIDLVFDPFHIEGEWEESTPLLPGSGSCFLAAFSHSLAETCTSLNPVPPLEIEKGIRAALIATRTFCRAGLSVDRDENKSFYKVTDTDTKLVRKEERIFSKAFVPSPFVPDIETGIAIKYHEWSILRGNYLFTAGADNSADYVDLACEISIKGPKSVLFAPVMTFGKIVTFDRHETESYRNIKKLMIDFATDKKSTKSLNLAVFGTPGSGKSFAVQEMSRTFLERYKPDILEFNLSQFKEATELSGAFHTIRDSVLKGKLPVVFWDEFDSGALVWLKSLLAPMQDGHFQDGKDTHPIGKAIFIFAGGTSSTFENFDPGNNRSGSKEKKQKVENFVLVKGPDFISRIHGYLNVCGPNQLKGDTFDVTYPVRRAMFIRNGLGMEKSDLLDIDYGLLRALLTVKSYKNGARSLDRILTHLKIRGNKRIVRSDLPSDEVITMNTSLADFYSIMCDDNLEEYQYAATLAPFIHNAWLGKKVTDSSFYREFFMLSNAQRHDNLVAAVRIRNVLAGTKKFGLDDHHSDMTDASNDFNTYIKTKRDLEPMAEMEHNLWMKERVKCEWKKGDFRSDYFRVHPDIEVYRKLPEREKEKDRDIIRKYSEFLEGSDFKIVRLGA